MNSLLTEEAPKLIESRFQLDLHELAHRVHVEIDSNPNISKKDELNLNVSYFELGLNNVIPQSWHVIANKMIEEKESEYQEYLRLKAIYEPVASGKKSSENSIDPQLKKYLDPNTLIEMHRRISECATPTYKASLCIEYRIQVEQIIKRLEKYQATQLNHPHNYATACSQIRAANGLLKFIDEQCLFKMEHP